MNLEDAYTHVKDMMPRVIHLSGKTSTGKSTFANRLHDDFGYEIIQLDQMVHDAVIKPLGLENVGSVFVEVYRNRHELEWIGRFVEATRQKVLSSTQAGKKVIIEGAIANTTTLQELLADLPEAVIIYLHPDNLDTYERNLTSRFVLADEKNGAGLPARFWEHVDTAEFDTYCKTRVLTPGLQAAIRAYAISSKQESAKRLDDVRSHFADVIAVDI